MWKGKVSNLLVEYKRKKQLFSTILSVFKYISEVDQLIRWNSDLDLIKLNALILINPPSPLYLCIEFYCSIHESYVDYASMSGKLIFFKGMLIHISENNDDLNFGYSVISNKTHLEYKLLQNYKEQSQICKPGISDHTCANIISHYSKFSQKNPNDMLYTLAIPHYS